MVVKLQHGMVTCMFSYRTVFVPYSLVAHHISLRQTLKSLFQARFRPLSRLCVVKNSKIVEQVRKIRPNMVKPAFDPGVNLLS